MGFSEGQVRDVLQRTAGDDEKLAYRRLKLLGQGSFGKAFLARDLSNNELVVMKQVEVEKMDSKARDTAVREAVALRRVQHPNVVRFREVFVRSGWLCLVMDFADGGDLCAAIKDRAKTGAPFEECAVLECFSQVCDAVSFVHSLKMEYEALGSHYSPQLHELVARMLVVEPSHRLDLPSALRDEPLAAPLRRSQEALGLVVRKEIQEEPVTSGTSEWIGYNTMIRSKEKDKALVETSPAHGPEPEGSPEGWSTAPAVDLEEELNASDDSWGSVVDTGVEALQHLVQDVGRYA
eukprot:g1116.t1